MHQARLRPNKSLQPTCYPNDCSTVDEDGELFDVSNRLGKARMRPISALAVANCHAVANSNSQIRLPAPDSVDTISTYNVSRTIRGDTSAHEQKA